MSNGCVGNMERMYRENVENMWRMCKEYVENM